MEPSHHGNGCLPLTPSARMDFMVDTVENEKLSPTSVILQDIPPSILDKNSQVDATKIHTVTSNLKETTERLNPEQSATVDITLPPKGNSLGICFTSDETYGFPLY